MPPKDADGMANIDEPDQTDYSTVFLGMYVLNL